MSEQTVRQYDWSVTNPVTAVFETMERVTNRSAEHLPPLAESVDPGAVNDLVGDAESEDVLVVSFQYAAHRVTIRSDATLLVEPEWRVLERGRNRVGRVGGDRITLGAAESRQEWTCHIGGWSCHVRSGRVALRTVVSRWERPPHVESRHPTPLYRCV